MPKLTKEDRILRQIIKEYGPELNLRTNPEVFIEIMRKYAMDLAEDGGLPPGGVGPVGPVAKEQGVQLEDVLKEIQKLQRQVAKLTKQLGQ